ncbi:tRNA A37 threonylcarbamoyladenosine biosynthesis protein TsaE [Myroides gitamensis]|nr:tRNA A37 threonylcarbamoyladenosine biosynthesis protein TsaE [Myroides gitamensis]
MRPLLRRGDIPGSGWVFRLTVYGFVLCEVCSPPYHLIGNYPITWQIAICHYGILHLTTLSSHWKLSCYLANCHLPLRDFTPHHLIISLGIILLLGKLPFATTGFYTSPPYHLIGNYPVTWQIAICHYGILRLTPLQKNKNTKKQNPI